MKKTNNDTNTGKLFWLLATLCVLGIIVSGYALYHHYSTQENSFCTINQTFNCDLVNRSTYSEIAKIPVAAIGILGYVFILFCLLTMRGRISDVLGLGKYWKHVLLIALIGGNLFSFYLSYIEAFILKAYCPVCLTSQGIMIALLIFGIIWMRKA